MMAALPFVLFAACLAVPALASAHSGGLDAHGCHHNRKAGGYHCHRGSLAGQSFASKDEMLKAPARGEAGTKKTAAEGELVGKVVSVHDGDTLTVLVSREQIKVRLLDIDAPERRQPFGTRSRQSLADLCAGRDARIAEQGKDRYGRTLGRVNCAGLDANGEQVRRGMAWVFERYAPKHSPLYAVQAEARAAKRGLWQDAKPVPPWEWRRNAK
jgi:endonuclease YncB( thermonuclease family)